MRLVWVSFVAFILAFSAGCPRPGSVQCLESGNCDRFPGGVCQATPSGNQWCAYPDSECPSGYRYSDLDVGDGVSGQCVSEDPGTDAGVDGGNEVHTLTVNVGGNGSGNVTSQPAGINCPAVSCTATFAVGTTVQLTATPTGSVFLGWSDGCNGAAECTVSLAASASVGALFGIPGEALWFNQVGSASEDFASEVFVDSQNNVYAGGRFQGTVTIGGKALTSAGSNDAFVAKLDSNTGAAAWAARFGSTAIDSADGIAVDSSGDVVVVGKFQGTVNFGGGNLVSAGDSDIFVVKLNGVTGAHIWSRRFGGTGNDGSGGAVVIDSAGAIVITGSFQSPTINFGGANLSNAGVGDLYLAKLANADGAHVWSRRMGGTASDVVNGLAIDASNNLVITGNFQGTTNLGGQDLVSAGMSDVLLAKYGGTDGGHLFSIRYGSTGADDGADVAVDSAGKIFVTGTFQGTVSFGGATPFTAGTGRDVFLVRVSLAGAHEWSKSIRSSTGFNFTGGVAVDSSNAVTLIGSFSGTLNLGGSNLSSAGTAAEVFAVSFDGATGIHLGSVRQGGTGQENGMGVAVASDGRLYCVGHFDGFAEFGGFGHTSAGGIDGFIVGLAPLK